MFLIGLVFVIVGFIIRVTLPESPVLEEIKGQGKLEKTPFFSLFSTRERVLTFLQVLLVMFAHSIAHGLSLTTLLEY